MKVLVIGGVAAGTKAAAKLKRTDRSAQVTLITKDQHISYAGCGLPYYVGGLIENQEELIVNTPAKYAALTGVEVLTRREAISLNPQTKTVLARNLETEAKEEYSYDACVIAVGASAAVPPVPGTELAGVFTMRTPEDAVNLRAYISAKGAKRALVVGAGFIGLEAAENLKAQHLSVTALELAPQIMPGVLDEEMAAYAKKHLQKMGIRIMTGTSLISLEGEEAVSGAQTSGGRIPADVVVLATGIRPNTDFLKDSGLAMEKGLIVTDEKLRTNLPDVYAAGDCAQVHNRLTGKPQWSPMGSSANYEGRTLAQVIGGNDKTYAGVLGTGVVRLPQLNAGRTGLTEVQAKAEGYDAISALCVTEDKAHYYPDAAFFVTKLVADRGSHRLLGAQVLGPGSVDKMIDIAAVGISMEAALEDFENMDLAYAPPFSTAIHPFVQAIYVLQNKLSGELESMTPAEYASGAAKGYTVLDVSKAPSIPGARYVNLNQVNGPLEGIEKDEKLLLVCTRGKRAYFLQNRLKQYGYTHTRVLEGSTFFNDVKVEGVKASVSAEDITRVKALGFLRDKRTADCFNGRVITRNGKITTEESRAIAEAAEKFGSGEITMTSRLTMEIQGVPYENIEPLREYLAQYGLETGGTGSKVRPVVSCKGTTCQYGLIDTFDLSEKIHERFYHGYSSVKLPHKFKIAVGGCPNNCVKPDLNDLGIIGQRVPEINLEKCRGCKVCQVENNCPIQVAQMADGKITIDPDSCNHCGRCLGKCPFHAVEGYTNGYKIYIGGRWGKRVAQGRPLEKIFTSEDEVLDVIEKAILLFREQGNTGERFSDTIARLGFENVQEQLLGDELLSRKEENLAAQKHLKGGATC
ncbi:MAG: FAD-dependent oxidoreductase [Lachnospiraceae bacterium]|jgi:NADPH-dependent 2,4-dienoyl-CoA reductase/sulfur reductase-like enzyme/dissimilatory sulfite reductase (desulfoviridin) alpha/beta subunit/rhodanese-related sulfurtransferase|nr:FAD-dependent oxidoreductase [Lachnospiraceae bacterium]